jgi:hypothetical protein
MGEGAGEGVSGIWRIIWAKSEKAKPKQIPVSVA